MKKKTIAFVVLLVGMIGASLGASGSDDSRNLLLNADFRERGPEGSFIGWRIWDETVAAKPTVGGGLELTVVKEKPGRLSEFGQRIELDRQNVNLFLNGRVFVDRPRMAQLQIKLYRNKREIGRQSVNTGKTDSDGAVLLRLFVNTGDADAIQVNLRTDTVGCLGKTARFCDLKLVETDRQIFPNWTESSGKFQRIDGPESGPESGLKSDSDAIRFVLQRSTGGDYQIRHSVHSVKTRDKSATQTELEFAARLAVSFVDFGYLKAELFQTGQDGQDEKIGEFKSSRNRYTTDVCRVRFQPGDADSVALSLCFDGAEYYAGEEAAASGFYFGPVRENLAETPAPKRAVQIVPGYLVCSVYLNCCSSTAENKFQSKLFYREAGSDRWISALDPVYVPEQRCARGTIVNLRENVGYEYRLEYSDSGVHETATGSFRTKTAAVPVARTIVLGEEFDGETLGPQKITESGTANGYVRYVLAKGKRIDGENLSEAAVTADNVSFAILDGLIVRGGKRHGIRLEKCLNVQVVNCDIADFGRVGKQRVELDGKYYEGRQAINNDAGISVSRTSGLLIERNWVHDPRGTANSWFYSHPAGPNALCIGASTDTAVRYNDFIGSDARRWNDVSEGMGNGSNNGAIWRDAEVCGNFFGFGNDDGMELDGGQINARFFYNRTEGCLCGVSTAPCRLGPAWYYRNVFCNAGDEFDLCGAGLKNVFGRLGRGRLYFFNNTILGYGGVSGPGGEQGEYDALANREPKLFKAMARNNLYGGGSSLNPQFFGALRSDFDFDLIYRSDAKQEQEKWIRDFAQETHGIALESQDGLFVAPDSGDYRLADQSPAKGTGEEIPNFLAGNELRSRKFEINIGAFQNDGIRSIPYRPVPFEASVPAVELTANGERTANGELTANGNKPGQSVDSQIVEINVEGTGYSEPFTVVQPEFADFFRVCPQTGTLKSGQTVRLTVAVDPAGVRQARRNTSAFAIRTASGFSRVVSVTVDSRENAKLLAAARKDAIYSTKIQPLDGGGTAIVFDIPADGEYWFFAKSGANSGAWRFASLDDGNKKQVIALGSKRTDAPWMSVASPVFGGEGGGPNRPYKLSAGKHTLTLYGKRDGSPVPVTAAAAAENPDAFRLAP